MKRTRRSPARDGEQTNLARARTPVGPAAELLPPRVLERLGGVALVSRYVVEGFVAGLHRSAYCGSGEEFSRHRPYQQGDDVRFIDWRLFGRTDRLHVREYREHSNLQAYILVDASLSMGYADADGITKLRYGCFVAAAFAHLMLRAGDAVGLASCGDEARLHLPPRNRPGYVQDLLLQLERLRPQGGGGLEAALDRVGEALRRRGRVIVISDFLEDDDGAAGILRAVGRLRARGDEVVLLRPLTPEELGTRPLAAGIYYDPEAPTRPVHAMPAADAGYRGRVAEYYERLGTRLRERGAELVLLSTAEPVEHALAGWLQTRR